MGIGFELIQCYKSLSIFVLTHFEVILMISVHLRTEDASTKKILIIATNGIKKDSSKKPRSKNLVIDSKQEKR